MLYWILSVICIVTLHSCVASKYYYKEDNGNYDVYYGPYPRWGYKEFRPPKSYKLRYEDRGNRPGKCIRGEFKCDSPYPMAKTKFFECELDYQCPRFYKCCQIHCFQHKICQPLDLEASDDNNEVPTDTPVIKTTSEVVTTQSSDSTVTSNSVGTQISTTTEFPTTLNGITTKEIVSTTATVTKEDHPSSNTFPYTATSKTTQQSTSRSTQIPTTKRKETTTSKRLTSTAFPSTQQVSKSTTMTANEDLQSRSIISTENSKTVDHHPPSSYTTISEPSTFQSSTTEIFETTTETYLPLDIFSTGAEGTETPKKVTTRYTLKPTTVVKNENSQFTTETLTEYSTIIDRITNGKETSPAVIVDDHTVTSTSSSFTTSTVTESPTSIITKLSPTKTTEITIVLSSPTTTEDKETITRKEISTEYTLKPTTVRENEHTRSTFVTSTKFDRITGEHGKDAGTTKKASSTVSSDQNGQEMTSDYTTTSSNVLTTSQIPEMKTAKGKTTVTSNISVRPTFATQFHETSTTKYSPPTTLMPSQTTSVKYGTTYKPTLEPESTATTQKTSESTSRKKQTTLIIDATSDDGYFVFSSDSEPESTINSESLLKSTTIVDVEATTKTLDTSKRTRTSHGPAVTSAITIPDSTYLPFNKTTSFTLDEIVSELSEPMMDDEDLNFSGDGDNPDDTLIKEKLTTTGTSIADDFTFNNESASKQEVPQSFLKSPYAREEAKGKELYDISSTIGSSEAARMSTQYISHSTAFPKSTAKVAQQPTSKSSNAENNNITSISTLLSTGSTPRATHVKDVESTTNDRTVTTFPISEYPYGNKIYMMDRLLGTFRNLPSVHEKAGDGGDNYNFNNFLVFLDKISDLLRKRNDTIYNNLDYQTTTVSEKGTSYNLVKEQRSQQLKTNLH